MLPVTVAAKLIGVSRARVYQRVTGASGGWSAGRPLEATATPSKGRGHRNGTQLKIALDVALAWRDERIAAGETVGEIPPEYLDAAARHAPAPKPPTIPRIVGMPNISPF